MPMNDGYYKNKTKLKKFHISFVIYLILFAITGVLAYLQFMTLFKLFFFIVVLSFFYVFYRGNVFYNHMKNKMEEKKKKGIKPAFDIDIIED